MPSEVNKPTGLGYQGSPWRECQRCHHTENQHYGQYCYAKGVTDYCVCIGFCAREPEEEGERIERELEVVGEVLIRELKDEVNRRGS